MQIRGRKWRHQIQIHGNETAGMKLNGRYDRRGAERAAVAAERKRGAQGETQQRMDVSRLHGYPTLIGREDFEVVGGRKGGESEPDWTDHLGKPSYMNLVWLL